MPTQPVTRPEKDPIPTVQSIVSVLWPSFLTAGLATILFFVLFDPRELAELLGYPDLSRIAGYTAGFFGFWIMTSMSCALTCYFRRPCHKPQSSDNESD